MFSKTVAALARNIAIACSLGCGAVVATPAAAQVTFLGTSGGYQVVCTGGSGGNILIRDNSCDVGGTGLVFPTGLQVGTATFNDATDAVTFSGGTVSFNSATTAFGGGTASFNNPVSFTGTSVTVNSDATFGNASTFNALADFNNGITSNSITNSGTVSTATLSATTIIGSNVTASGAFYASAATTVDMGFNIIHSVGAGVAATDAVNVGQLTAATSGIVTDVTALETLTDTHTTQISAIQTVNTTQANQISALEASQLSVETDIGTLFDLRNRDRRDMKQGVAAAMSMAQAPMPSAPGKVAYTVNGATFRGEYAVGASLTYRLNTEAPTAINLGASFAGNKNNGARLGISGEF